MKVLVAHGGMKPHRESVFVFSSVSINLPLYISSYGFLNYILILQIKVN